MSAYKIDQKVKYQGKEVQVIQVRTEHPSGKRRYLLSNGKTLSEKELSQVGTDFGKLAKEIKSESKKSKDIQIKEPIKEKSAKVDSKSDNEKE